MAKSILILNGPGLADRGQFGGSNDSSLTLADVDSACNKLCKQLDIEVDFRQTDSENEMFRYITRDSESYDGVIINPVGHSKAATVNFEMFRHAITLIARLKKPVVEVHISNIFGPNAEVAKPLRVTEGEIGFISGLGLNGYLLAIRAINKRIDQQVS